MVVLFNSAVQDGKIKERLPAIRVLVLAISVLLLVLNKEIYSYIYFIILFFSMFWIWRHRPQKNIEPESLIFSSALFIYLFFYR